MESPEDSAPDSKKLYKHVCVDDIYTALTTKKLPDFCTDKTSRYNFNRQMQNYLIEGGRLYYRKHIRSGQNAGIKNVEVLRTTKEREEVIKLVHEGSDSSSEASALSSHRGRNKMMDIIAARYFWHKMKDDVSSHIARCSSCQKVNPSVGGVVPELHPVPVAKEVMQQLGVDLCNLPAVDGFQYVAVAIDYFSKWSEAEALFDKSAASVARFLYKLICRHGCFKIQINDQGREFCNSVSQELHRLTGVEQRLTSAYHPQANGLVERQNRTIKDSLLKVLQQRIHEWPNILDGVLFAHRTSVHSSTGYSPSFLLYNRHLSLPVDVRSSSATQDHQAAAAKEDHEASGGDAPFDMHQFDSNLERIMACRDATHQAASENISRAQKRQKASYDKRHASSKVFRSGDNVLLRNLRRKDRKGGWSQLPWLGPYSIEKVYPNKVCSLRGQDGKVLRKKANLKNLKPFVDAADSMTDEYAFLGTKRLDNFI